MFGIKQVPLYLRKLVAISLLLGLLPVILLGLYSYYKSTSVVKKELNAANANTVFLTEMRVEQLLTLVDNSATQLITSPIVSAVSDKPLSYKHFQSFQALSEMLHGLQRYDSGIYDVTFVNLNQGWFMNNQESGALEEKVDADLFHRYSELDGTSVWRRQAVGSPYTSGVDLIRKMPINTLKPFGLLMIRIQAAKLNELISQVTDHHILILDEQYHPVANNVEASSGAIADLALTDAELTVLSERIRNGAQENVFQLQAGNDKYGVSYRKSGYNGWTYVSLVPMKSISGELSSIRWVTLAICFTIILFIALFAVVASRKMYGPIGLIYQSLLSMTDLRKERVADRDELKFIDQRVRQIVTDNVALESRLSWQLNHLREYFVLKLLRLKLKPIDITEWFPFADLWSIKGVVAVQIDTLEGTRYEERDLPPLLYAVNNMVLDLVPASKRLTPIIIDDYQMTIIGFTEVEDYRTEMYKLAETIQQKVKEFLQIQVSLGISSAFWEWRHVGKAYHESIDVLKYRVKLDKESILMIDDIRPRLEDSAEYPEEVATELLDAIKRLNLDEADRLLTSFLERIFIKDANYQVYQMALVRLVVDIHRIAETFGGEWRVQQEKEKSVFDQLFELRTSEEIKQWLMRGIVVPVVETIDAYLTARQFKISEMMLELIHERYNTDLTLEICAKTLNYHPNYLKRVFRNETGTNFSDYLTRHRMKVAKQLLHDPAVKVSDIADKVGYSSPQNFIRYFRRIEGMTPGEYRRKLAE